jgi:hypothetical protein
LVGDHTVDYDDIGRVQLCIAARKTASTPLTAGRRVSRMTELDPIATGLRAFSTKGLRPRNSSHWQDIASASSTRPNANDLADNLQHISLYHRNPRNRFRTKEETVVGPNGQLITQTIDISADAFDRPERSALCVAIS